MFSQVVNQFTREKFSAISKIDSKGRVSIPICLRVKLKLLEGSRVKFLLLKDRLLIIPENGQSSVKASTEVCETSRPGSIPDSGPKKEVIE